MTLIDTTVWIAWLRDRDTQTTRHLDMLLDEGEALLTPVVLQEILQGAKSAKALDTLQKRFQPLPMLSPTPETYAKAGALYAHCRWQGITPRSPHDYLIAQIAVENQVPLLHDDRDFLFIAQIEPALILWPESRRRHE